MEVFYWGFGVLQR